jgi:hypothetical protein
MNYTYLLDIKCILYRTHVKYDRGAMKTDGLFTQGVALVYQYVALTGLSCKTPSQIRNLSLTLRAFKYRLSLYSKEPKA